MPWHIVPNHSECSSGQFAVVKDSDGTVEGCHDTQGEAEDHMAALYAAEGGENSMPIRTHPVRARPIRDQARQAELLTVAQERALEPDIFDEFPPFFWEGEFSNSLLDGYYTRMSARTLANYAADAQAGIAFLRGHAWHELPLGQSLSGRLETHEGRQRVLANFYTITGMEETDGLVRRMRSGIARDLSVGFYGGRELCEVCGRDYWRSPCPHIRGLTYEVEGEDGVVRQVLATVEIDDAHASEVSAVFDGATPQAEITKARQLARAGELKQVQIGVLEARYRIQLPGGRRWPGADIPGGNNHDMNADEQLQQMRSALQEAGYQGNDALAKALADAGEVAQLREQNATLEAQAAEGRQYRQDLVADALAEGVRAYGEEFDQDGYKAMLDSANLDQVKRMRDDWAKVAGKRFPGGRQSREEDTPPDSNEVRQLVPDEAYG